MARNTVIRAALRFRAVLNNYHVSDDNKLRRIWDEKDKHFITYMLWGYEVGEQGTKHFQAYFIFSKKRSLRQLKALFGQNWHFDNCDRPHSENYRYCTKDEVFMEFGKLPKDPEQGKRTDLYEFRDWASEEYRTERDVAKNFPDVYLKYARSTEMSRVLAPPPKFHDPSVEITWRPWQMALVESVRKEENDDRSVEFYIDEKGGIGKTFLAKWLQDEFPERVQLLCNGPAKDIAYLLDESKDTFIFNVPKGDMEYISYKTFEGIKDRIVTSTKYQPVQKYFKKKTRVIVFGNEDPDVNRMSEGRIKITHLYNP